MEEIIFASTSNDKWLRKISEVYDSYRGVSKRSSISVVFSKSVKVNTFFPLHLVTLACLIQYLVDKGHKVYINSTENKDVYEYIYNDLMFSAYWRGGKNHVNATLSNNIFNLWRIVDEEKDLYAKNVELYFKNILPNKDLSPISIALTESYYNVFDHADAKKNAFSLLKYDDVKQILYAAISDYGIGITTSVRKIEDTIIDDKRALEKALEYSFTVKSTERNRGFGLNNILSNSTEARIFSGKALMTHDISGTKYYSTDFRYNGTLIYFEVDLSSLQAEEIIEEFEW